MGFRALTQGVASSYSELKRLSDITGFTIKQIRGLEFAMRRIGSASPVASGQKLAQLIPDIVRRFGQGQLNQDAFYSNKFQPSELARISKSQGNDAATEYFLNAYGSMNTTERAYMRSGVGISENDDIARLGEYGGKFFRDSMNMSNAMTPEIDPKLAKVAQDFNDEMAKLARNFENLAYSMGSQLLPIVNKFLDVVNGFIHENPEVASTMIGAAGVAGIAAGGGVLSRIFRPKSPSPGGGFASKLLAAGGLYVTSAAGYEAYNRAKAAWNGEEFGGIQSHSGEMSELERLKARNLAVNSASQVNTLHQALDNPNARSYLDAISRAEGTSAYMNSGYYTLFGGGQVASLSDHPRQLKDFQQTDGTWNKTSAAGRYQFTQTSWDEAATALGLNDFSPRSQDLAALWLIQRAGQLDSVMSGDFMTATNNLGGVWASLPSSPYAQPKRSLSDMENYYTPAYVEQRNQLPYNSSAERSDASKPVSITLNNTQHISGLGLNEQQVQDTVANALTTAGENLERSFNNNRW